MIEILTTSDLAIFKTYPYLRKPMTDAFDIAWSLLKALPEQQAFEEIIQPTHRFGFKPRVVQRRLGAVHPAIMGMMDREQTSRAGKSPRMDVINESSIFDGGIRRPPIKGQLQHSPYPSAAYDARMDRRAQVERGSVFDTSRKFGTTPEGKPYQLSRHERGHEGIYDAHPPKNDIYGQPVNPVDPSFLQSIGF